MKNILTTLFLSLSFLGFSDTSVNIKIEGWDGDWYEGDNRFYQELNDNGDITLSIHTYSTNDFITYDTASKILYTYNTEGNLILTNFYSLGSNGLYNNKRVENYYSNNSLDSIITYTISSTGTASKSRREYYEYDANGNAIEEYIYVLSGSGWFGTRILNRYENGLLVRKEVGYEGGTFWDLDSMDSLFYNEKEQLIESIHYSYDFSPVSALTYEYDLNSNRTKLTSYSYSAETRIPLTIVNTTYDESNRVSTIINQSYSAGEWNNTTRTSYSYSTVTTGFTTFHNELAYNNPVGNTLSFSDHKAHQIIILNTNGQVVLQSTKTITDVSSLTSGTYILIIDTVLKKSFIKL